MPTTGINFRLTSGYVTDDATETYCLGDAYPTTRGGITFGWLNAVGGTRDRDNTFDRRLAGINFDFSGVANTFQWDLSASGAYTFRCALGDPVGNSGVGISMAVKDGGTTLLTVSAVAVSGFLDATSADYSAANWPGSNTSASVTYSGTTATFVFSPLFEIATHLSLVASGGGGGGSTTPSYPGADGCGVFYRSDSGLMLPDRSSSHELLRAA